jgi:hypothetical protein
MLVTLRRRLSVNSLRRRRVEAASDALAGETAISTLRPGPGSCSW